MCCKDVRAGQRSEGVLAVAMTRSNDNSFTSISRTILTMPCTYTTRVHVNPKICHRGLIYRGRSVALVNTNVRDAHVI